MADTATDFDPPLFGLRFAVAFTREPIAARGGGSGAGGEEPLCRGAFSEVTGLDASMEARTIKEGGANYGAHQRAGPVSFGTVVMKRGMTAERDLWNWWGLVAGGGTSDGRQRPNGAFAYRLTVRITLLDLDGTPRLKWRLERALPVKFKTADFNARGAEVGIEELHLVHEGLFMEAV
ncbi:phage tail protein [Azohydromonas aeria]|uniref:phage tail protein n=1 Tax=Azohydromonas aeria TaxID=2590212 RepID=UPI0012F96AB2|nr:phage tail protein [Azohydromonas aeria]